MAVLSMAIVVPALFWPVLVLEISCGRTGDYLWFKRVAPGQQFSLEFIHSVTLRPVKETYRVEPDATISIVEMEFDSSGPNLPAGPEGSTRWIIEKDRFRVVDYDVRLPEIALAVGQVVANHKLVLNRYNLSLVDIAGPGSYIKIAVRRRASADFLAREVSVWLHSKRKKSINGN